MLDLEMIIEDMIRRGMPVPSLLPVPMPMPPRNDNQNNRECVCEGLYVKNVIHNGKVTVVFFSDGTKEVAKCSKNDTFDPEKGILVAVCKKLIGSKNMNNLLKTFTTEEYIKETK